ncbi:DUF6362 family protein [Rhizobium sp. NLR22b]|uniref:DUF6362 family protein n=1 Tax=Rhizobium sp. NLR22b TaxID=2731115 RepID=UPI001C82E8F2|nr:DUF6362 family protein [Rhizobium sp. NLR22b]MBX5238644.1 hypothetical protein [Rhizobium sp. NLR22b]
MITGREIGERFIRAVEISMRSFASVGPKVARRAVWIEYQYTQGDKNGWGAERLAEERKDFWSTMRTPSAREISEAEETQQWLFYIDKEHERQCLTAWAWCMARRQSFKDWCAEQGFHVETGRRRKERAILRILLAMSRKPLQHNEIDVNAMLPDIGEMSDKHANIAEGVTHWRADDAKPKMVCDFDQRLMVFDWADKQNERRKQRDAERRKRTAA